MMQAGKDYLAMDAAEYESPRALYLRELLKSVAAQAPSDEEVKAIVEEAKESAKAEAGPAKSEPIKPINQNKPTLKLK